MSRSRLEPPGEIIGEWRYFRDETGDLRRAWLGQSAETARTEFVVPAANAEFALRCARLSAGLPEYPA